MELSEVWRWASSVAVVAVRESSLEWVELREVWIWASSTVVCFLCSWRHSLRLLTESFRASKSSFNYLISFFTSFLNSMMLACIDLMEESILVRLVAIVVAAGKIQAMRACVQYTEHILHATLLPLYYLCFYYSK